MSLLASIIPSLSRSSNGGEDNASAPVLKPVYDVKENSDAYELTVHLPGVAKEGLSITAEDNEFRLRGERGWKRPTGWTALYRESADLPFELVLQHDNAIAVAKIQAELRDGVLRISLPKTEARKPRKIAVS